MILGIAETRDVWGVCGLNAACKHDMSQDPRRHNGGNTYKDKNRDSLPGGNCVISVG